MDVLGGRYSEGWKESVLTGDREGSYRYFGRIILRREQTNVATRAYHLDLPGVGHNCKAPHKMFNVSLVQCKRCAVNHCSTLRLTYSRRVVLKFAVTGPIERLMSQ